MLYIALNMSGIEAVSVLKLTSNWCTRVSRVSSVSGVFGQELVFTGKVYLTVFPVHHPVGRVSVVLFSSVKHNCVTRVQE